MDTVPMGTEVRDSLEVRARGKLRRAAEQVLRAVDLTHGSGDLRTITLRRLLVGATNGEFDGTAIRVKPNEELELTIAHEIGHWLDSHGIPGPGYDSASPSLPEMERLLDAIRQTVRYRDAQDLPPGDLRDWLLDPAEMFARAYGQWLAWKSGSASLLRDIDSVLQDADDDVILEQWPFLSSSPSPAPWTSCLKDLDG